MIAVGQSKKGDEVCPKIFYEDELVVSFLETKIEAEGCDEVKYVGFIEVRLNFSLLEEGI